MAAAIESCDGRVEQHQPPLTEVADATIRPSEWEIRAGNPACHSCISIHHVADAEWLKLHSPIQPQRQPTPTEHVWTLRKNGKEINCELRFHGESYGWECRFLHDGELAYGQRFVTRHQALAEGQAQRESLLAQRWTGYPWP
jgi:hypothetical protein